MAQNKGFLPELMTTLDNIALSKVVIPDTPVGENFNTLGVLNEFPCRLVAHTIELQKELVDVGAQQIDSPAANVDQRRVVHLLRQLRWLAETFRMEVEHQFLDVNFGSRVELVVRPGWIVGYVEQTIFKTQDTPYFMAPDDGGFDFSCFDR